MGVSVINWRRVIPGLCLVVFAIGLHVLLGWVLDNDSLRRLVSGPVAMKANTAIGLMFCSAALALLTTSRVNPSLRRLLQGMTLLMTACAGLTLSQDFTGRDLGLDQWLLPDLTGPGRSKPGRMSPPTALCLMLLGSALLVLSRPVSKRVRLPVLAGLGVAVATVGLSALVGRTLNNLQGVVAWNFSPMATDAALSFVLLGGALLMLVRSEGGLAWALDGWTTTGFAAGLVLLLTTAAGSYYFTRQLQQQAERVSHTQQVIESTERLVGNLTDVTTGLRGYLIMGEPQLLAMRERLKAQVHKELGVLRKLTADNARQQQRLADIAPLIEERFQLGERMIAARRDHGFAAAQAMLAGTGNVPLNDNVRRLYEEMRREEYTLLEQRQQRFESISIKTFLVLPMTGFVSLTMLLLGVFFLNRGVVERNRLNLRLSSSQALFRAMFEATPDGIVVTDAASTIVKVNPGAERLFGYAEGTMIGLPVQQLSASISSEAMRSERAQLLEHMPDAPVGHTWELDGLRRDGSLVPMEVIRRAFTTPRGAFVIGVTRDITARREAERKNQRLTNFYAALSQTNQAVVHVQDADQLFRHICRICVEYGHAKIACIGLLTGAQVVSEVVAGPAQALAADLLMPLGPGVDGANPLVMAIRGGERYICNDFLGDPATLPWRERAHDLGTRALAAFPFRRAGEVAGVLSLHVPEKDFFTPELIALLNEMMGDLSFALDNIDREKARSEAELALRGSEQRIRNLFEQAADGIFVLTNDQRYLEANATGLAMLGYHLEELLDLHVQDVLAVHEHQRLTTRESKGDMGTTRVEEWVHRRKDGSTFEAEVSTRELFGGQFLAIVRDLTPRRKAERESRLAYERFEKIFLGAPEAMSVTEIDSGRFVLVNDAYCHTLGYTRQELLGRTAIELGMWIDISQRDAMLTTLRSGRPVRGMEWHSRSRSGEPLELLCSADSIDMEGQTYTLLMFSDITDRKRAEARIEYIANHDSLTGLPNRTLMRDRITQAINHARRSERQLALLYLDLDRFKVINDGYGHSLGDSLLKAVGERLLQVVREGDTVARPSGDEFVILLADLRKFSDAHIVAQKALDACSKPVLIGSREVYITMSIGVSIYPQNGEDADELISHADVAMYRSKTLGRGTYQFFTQEMSEATQQQVALETRLRMAIAQKELSLVYQPKVDLASGRIVGCEALLRWQHPELGAVSPARFIPIAEESGLIVPIGDWVLRAACRQGQAWVDAGLPAVVMSVNVSARQFLQQDVVQWVFRTLQDTGLAPELLELELTESLIAQDTEKVIATVAQLKAARVKLSIDDFGTGYSSLSYLKRFRVDTLKIDQSFIRNMLKDAEEAAIPLAVISMAHSLKLNVIAEGVETAEQCDFLRQHGCDEIQGYFFSKPVPAEAFAQMLRDNRRLS